MTDGRKLVVYVGATWCEPCLRFQSALKAGSLHAAFPKVRFLELDADRHARPVRDANCQSDFIPLFAVPDPSGQCSASARIAGGVKGDGAVANLVPRLQALLAGGLVAWRLGGPHPPPFFVVFAVTSSMDRTSPATGCLDVCVS